ncbi:dual specificity protein kinase splA-like [Amphibalanus amphitrite]|uniref:dual specificity protein kinase splA-like n=1 Tax=Amphibalanus amphitrite TaxID=1232801 RepID=UPI001C8FC222|nr:dual specificity protein kinase splA-like [Amphibalanus amphitrite]
MRAVASVYPWALSLIFVTSCVVVTSLEAAEPSGAASAPYRHAGDHALVHAAGVETGHRAELLVTNAAAGGTPLAVRSRRDLHSGSEDAQSSDTPGSEELPPGGDGGAQQPPPSDGTTNAASTIRSPAAAAVESSDEGAAEPRDGGSSEAASDVPRTVPESRTPPQKTQPADTDDHTISVDAPSAVPVLEEVEQEDVEAPSESAASPKAIGEKVSSQVTSPGNPAVDPPYQLTSPDSPAVDLPKVTSLTSSRDDSAAVVSSSPSQVASPPTSPAVDSSGPTQTNVPSADTADEGKERGAPSELHENTSDGPDVSNNNNDDDSSENRNDNSNSNINSDDGDDDNSSNEDGDITDRKTTSEDGAADGDNSAAATSSWVQDSGDSAEDPGDSAEDPGDSAEDSGDSAEDSGDDSTPGVRRSPPRTVNGTVLEAGPGPWDSPADRARRRNVTTFALVMCGIVGATFVILVGMWINRMRHRDRLRNLQDHDDEEFTVFSASEARYVTNLSGGGYEPLR